MGRRQFMRMVVAVAATAVPAMASADLTIWIDSTTVIAGGNGSLDLFVSQLGENSETLGGFTFGFTVTGPGPNPFTFSSTVTKETDPVEAPGGYVFPNSIGPIWPGQPPSGLHHNYLDLDPVDPRVTSTGIVYGGGHSTFTVSPDAVPGEYQIAFNFGDPTDPENVSYTIATTTADVSIPTQWINGTITVLPAAVPEPSAAVLLALSGVAGIVVKRRKKSRSAAA